MKIDCFSVKFPTPKDQRGKVELFTISKKNFKSNKMYTIRQIPTKFETINSSIILHWRRKFLLIDKKHSRIFVLTNILERIRCIANCPNFFLVIAGRWVSADSLRFFLFFAFGIITVCMYLKNNNRNPTMIFFALRHHAEYSILQFRWSKHYQGNERDYENDFGQRANNSHLGFFVSLRMAKVPLSSGKLNLIK